MIEHFYEFCRQDPKRMFSSKSSWRCIKRILGRENSSTIHDTTMRNDFVKIQKYYHNLFSSDLNLFMPSRDVPYFGHSWGRDFDDLDKVEATSRPMFLICLYFTVLVDQAMYTYYRPDYQRFQDLTKYPKFCVGLGQFQRNLREILFQPARVGVVDPEALREVLPSGMVLFVEEVVDFLGKYMSSINPAEFFDKLIYDSDVQIPEVFILADPELEKDVVVVAYKSLRKAVENQSH